MKLLIVAVCLAVGCNAFTFELEEDWNNFKETFSKKYVHAREEAKRRSVWEQNINKIASHNRLFDLGFRTFTLGQNEYADLTREEFRQMMNGFKAPKQRDMINIHHYSKAEKLADTVDWRDKNVVTEVKNQQQCGSCWAFSTTGSVEGQHALKTKKLVSLSEQQLIDCSGDYGNMGCDGGLMDNAFDYIKDNGGIDTEESYPYEEEQGDCRFKKDSIGATVTGHVDIPTGDEKALQDAVAKVGPVSVAIDASHEEFQLYQDGVFDLSSCSSQQLDHGVLVVGYGTEDGKDYWLVKNSWGASWGSQGYIKMSRNKSNQCGIATMASYPTV